MADDHESWLRKQGVKIVGRHTLRRAVDPGYMNWGPDQEDGRIDWSADRYKIREEQVYQVELDERTIDRLRHNESMIINALEYASRLSKRGTLNSNSIEQYFIDNSNRHQELLKENSMYRDAWIEFQSIRVLLGETPHWP